MIFSARTSGPESVKAVINAISTLVEEATFEATSEGIAFKGMDPSHVALIDIFWPNAAFASYSCDSEVKFGVRIDELTKLIKRASKTDDIELKITEENRLEVTIGKNKHYKMRLIEGSATETPLPKISFDTKILLTYATLEKALGDVQVVSEYLTISVQDGNVEFSGRGDSGDATVSIDAEKERAKLGEIGEEQNIVVRSEQNSTGTYSLDYLMPVIKAVGNATEKVACEFSTTKPLRVEFIIGNMGHIHFYLAPRVES